MRCFCNKVVLSWGWMINERYSCLALVLLNCHMVRWSHHSLYTCRSFPRRHRGLDDVANTGMRSGSGRAPVDLDGYPALAQQEVTDRPKRRDEHNDQHPYELVSSTHLTRITSDKIDERNNQQDKLKNDKWDQERKPLI